MITTPIENWLEKLAAIAEHRRKFKKFKLNYNILSARQAKLN